MSDPARHPPERSGSPGEPATRARRTISLNVDYNLKKRRIIPSEDARPRKNRPVGRPPGRPPGRPAGSKTASSTPSSTPSSSAASSLSPQDENHRAPQSVIQHDATGAVQFHEPESVDPVNGMTGLPLSAGPPEKVKKESLWSYRKGAGASASASTNASVNAATPAPSESSASVSAPASASASADVETPASSEDAYRARLQTQESEQRTRPSSLRAIATPKDIYRTKRQYRKRSAEPRARHFPTHTKIKASTTKENKLFGQNSITNQKALAPPLASSAEAAVENDDFCASCRQPGIFLCCDTCPKSFHFACCNPPLDPDNLPEGDWSCAECQFRIRCPNKAAAHRLEKDYLAQLERSKGITLFGKLLFRLEFTNPKQYLPPHPIRDAFADVRTGSHGEYADNSMREPLNEKQIFGSGYGQSLTKMDQYNPELHVDPESGELLVCFKCRKSKMGTLDHPEDERLITRCDYCNTPWHLDCVPHVPRASFKNLGSKWMCPLHADSSIPHQERRLARHQRHFTPANRYRVPNDGDIDVQLDEISVPVSKDALKEDKINKELAILQLPESSIKIDFVDKIYRAKSALMDKHFRQQQALIDNTMHSKPSLLSDARPLLYFSLQDNSQLRKLWDFKELCRVATKELEVPELDSAEISELQTLRKLLESKSKEEVMEFLGIKL
ncbi:Rco1p [Lachancea thermotolerans CBS 6340]|uniref:KLTH0D07040p n=1 Tax=Lachancea thermotolerans (strain ATCC 56472 / CBS 6340 / NRRL Y-8284) TaxID=559295 RepID=C5DGP7_LACTC|nr:KLTH0D07040p [Lachancea thermotolerans CBS 6340]CAR22589.1 KLTH0D07040p [Lachancea thermotolerans CBS 6340]